MDQVGILNFSPLDYVLEAGGQAVEEACLGSTEVPPANFLSHAFRFSSRTILRPSSPHTWAAHANRARSFSPGAGMSSKYPHRPRHHQQHEPAEGEDKEGAEGGEDEVIHWQAPMHIQACA